MEHYFLRKSFTKIPVELGKPTSRSDEVLETDSRNIGEGRRLDQVARDAAMPSTEPGPNSLKSMPGTPEKELTRPVLIRPPIRSERVRGEAGLRDSPPCLSRSSPAFAVAESDARTDFSGLEAIVSSPGPTPIFTTTCNILPSTPTPSSSNLRTLTSLQNSSLKPATSGKTLPL